MKCCLGLVNFEGKNGPKHSVNEFIFSTKIKIKNFGIVEWFTKYNVFTLLYMKKNIMIEIDIDFQL